MLSFGIVVAANNIVALARSKSFLLNRLIHTKTNWFQERFLNWAVGWVEKEAMIEFKDLQSQIQQNSIGASIKDCSAPIFTVLTLAEQDSHQSLETFKIKNGSQLFHCIYELELEIERLKKPREEIKNG